MNGSGVTSSQFTIDEFVCDQFGGNVKSEDVIPLRHIPFELLPHKRILEGVMRYNRNQPLGGMSMKHMALSILLPILMITSWEDGYAIPPEDVHDVSWILNYATNNLGRTVIVSGVVSSLTPTAGVTVNMEGGLSFYIPLPAGYAWIGNELLPSFNKNIHTKGLRKTYGRAFLEKGDTVKVKGNLKKEVGHFILTNANIVSRTYGNNGKGD